MAWYKTGTVSITAGATSVTGVGTKFASNSRVGDAFTGPDGRWYEVVNIASETVIGIYPGYLGPTVSASANWTVAPMQGYVKESADRLRALLDGLQYVDSPRLKSIATAVTSVNDILIADTATTMAALATGTTGRLLLATANAAAARTAIGATTVGSSLITAADAAAARTAIGATATGNSLITASNAAAGRTALALGTSSTVDVTTSTSDGTVGRVSRIGDFGLGGNGIGVTDANTITQSGNYVLATAAAGGVNGPPQIGTVAWAILHFCQATNNGIQIAGPMTGVSTNKYRLFHRQNFSGTWSAWMEFADTDTVASIIAQYGIGTNTLPNIPDLNVFVPSGLYRAVTSSTNKPTSGACTVICLPYSTTSMQQIAVLSDGTIYSRGSVDTGTTWSAWRQQIRQDDFGLGTIRMGDLTFANPLIAPSAQGNTSPSTFFGVDGSADQAVAHQPVVGEEFAGVGCSRALRPVQFGVSGRGSAAKFFFRGYSGASSVVSDWRQLADLVSPSFTGNPTAPNRADRDSSTSIATTSFVEKTLGFAGIGENATNRNNIVTGTNLNDVIKPGLWAQNVNANATLALNYPITTAGTLLVAIGGASIVTQMYQQYNTGRSWTRSAYNGTWSGWLETVNDSSLNTTLGSFGLGNNVGPAVTNLDDAILGSVSRYAASATNTPLSGASGVVFTMGYSTGASGYSSQIAITVQTSDANLYNRMFTRTRNQGTWGPWKESLTSNTTDSWGLGVTSAPLIADINAIRMTGWYQCDATQGVAIGLPLNVGYSIQHVAALSVSGHTQWATPLTSVAANKNRVFHRQMWSGAWSAWEEVAYLGSTKLDGYAVGANSAVAATDTVISALGKLQGQINATQPVNRGGTGATTAAGARTNLGLGSAAVVDVVGTVASGAIIENISNANGRAIKYADGTMICLGSYSLPAGAINTQSAVTITYASNFYSPPNIVNTPSTADGTGSQADIGLNIYNGIYVSPNETTCVFSSYRYRSATTFPVIFNYHAIGRWKA